MRENFGILYNMVHDGSSDEKIIETIDRMMETVGLYKSIILFSLY